MIQNTDNVRSDDLSYNGGWVTYIAYIDCFMAEPVHHIETNNV